MNKILVFSLLTLPLMANITGTVNNLTTGKPQAGATVTFYRFGQGGMEPVKSVKADAKGNFAIDQEPGMQGPSMLRVEIDGINYNYIMRPGSRAQDVLMDVYNASKQQGEAKVTKHMILFQPANGQMTVNETFLLENHGKTTWADPANGTLQFYLPAGSAQVEMQGSAPDGGGMAVPVPTDKAAKKDVYKAKFEIKPGETRFDLNYTVPYTAGSAYGGSIVSGDDNTYLIAPAGVTLEGSNLQDLGQEPRTKARIYGLSATSYIVKLTGEAAAVAAPSADDSASNDAAPQIEEMMPRLYRKGKLIIGLALGILALGFAVLYRASAPGEANERGRG